MEILDHLIQKETPFDYLDTHSGAGLYDLQSSHAEKLQEHTNGIGKLRAEDFPELAHYFEAINAYNKSGGIHFYPGSPLIAKYFLRPCDRAWLYELHPQDYDLLRRNMGNNKKIRVSCQDGLKGMLAQIPPVSRRGFVLIDPSYEIKSEYDDVFDALMKAYKKFSTGIYAVWYPVVDRHKIDNLENKLVLSGIKNIQRFELGLSADSEERGMTSSGLFVINPPWKLFDKMSTVLPRLAQLLSEQNQLFYKCDTISSE